MERYCANCKKSFDFAVKSMRELDSLVCPECGCRIDRNSRNPARDMSAQTEKTEAAIGNVFSVLARINYFFYLTVSGLAIAAYFMHWDRLLYVLTGISLGMFVLQLFVRSMAFRTGIFFVPLGAAAGYFILKSARGACLGIAVVFVARHLFRALFFRLISKLFTGKT